ncbi:hypothetical protein M949_1327 [Riemerella anatipestifer CH3]|nr:hypothetical protein M949_1327 [Riemerella anatipestifer CH3]
MSALIMKFISMAHSFRKQEIKKATYILSAFFYFIASALARL